MELKFPLAKKLKTSKLVMPVWVEQKLDGWRLMIWKGNAYGRNKNVMGRYKNRWNNLPDHIKSLAQDFPVDGELIWPGHDATDVPTALKAVNPELQFIGFHLTDSYLTPKDHWKAVGDLGIKRPKILIPCYYTLEAFDIASLILRAEHDNVEGYILKERYTVPTWWKLKVEDTYDLIVTGITWPTAGKYKTMGWIKSLQCSTYINGVLTEVAHVSGMKENIRSKISEKDIGRVVEVKANLLASQGRLKHPRFIRWRDDKNATECTLDRE